MQIIHAAVQDLHVDYLAGNIGRSGRHWLASCVFLFSLAGGEAKKKRTEHEHHTFFEALIKPCPQRVLLLQNAEFLFVLNNIRYRYMHSLPAVNLHVVFHR